MQELTHLLVPVPPVNQGLVLRKTAFMVCAACKRAAMVANRARPGSVLISGRGLCLFMVSRGATKQADRQIAMA